MEKDDSMDYLNFQLVFRTWTPIGKHGFKYYWDPQWIEPLTGCKEVHFMNAEAGFSRQFTVNPDQADSAEYISWLVRNAYTETVNQWLRTTKN
jgi:hypothetical protein